MRDFMLKLCLFIFLTAVLSAHTNPLAALAGAVTGTVLVWPIYARLLPARVVRKPRAVVIEERDELPFR